MDKLNDENLILIVNSKEFHCLSEIIFKRSSFFEKLMIENNFKEKLVIDWNDENVFQLLLDFYYDKKIDINETNIRSILQMSQKFSADDLLIECEKFLINSINLDNCLNYLEYSKFLYKEKKTNFISKFVRKNLKDIFDSQILLKLNYKEFKKFILDEDLGCNFIPLKIIFKTINKWIQFDIDTRIEKYENLLKSFDWLDCLETDLFNLIKEEKVFEKNKTLLYVFLKVMKSSFNLKQNSEQFEILKIIYEKLIPASLDKKENIDLQSQNSTLSILDDPGNFDFSFYNSFELEPIENANLDISSNLTEDFFQDYLLQNKENSSFLNFENSESLIDELNNSERPKKNLEVSCLIPIRQTIKRKNETTENLKKKFDKNNYLKKLKKASSKISNNNEDTNKTTTFVNFYASLAEWKKGVKCIYCIFETTDCRKLDLHLRTMHKRYFLFEFPYSCEICSFRTKTKIEVVNHCQNHYCNKCKIKFTKKKIFVSHFKKCKTSD